MLLETLSTPWRKARQTNTTDGSFPARIALAAKPSGIGDAAGQATKAIHAVGGGGSGRNAVIVSPYGVGANDNTLSIRVYGWSQFGINPNTLMWVPTMYCEIQATLSSTLIGIAGRDLLDTELMADTLAVTYGPKTIDTDSAGAASTGAIEVFSPANNLPAHFIVPLFGADLLEFTFTTGSSATSCNALFRLL